MEEYLESKTLSWDSKTPVSNKYWKNKHLDILRIVYHAVKRSEESENIFDVNSLYKRTLSGVDLLTYSFPCKDLSQQGIQRGMKKRIWNKIWLIVANRKSFGLNYKKWFTKVFINEKCCCSFK